MSQGTPSLTNILEEKMSLKILNFNSLSFLRIKIMLARVLSAFIPSVLYWILSFQLSSSSTISPSRTSVFSSLMIENSAIAFCCLSFNKSFLTSVFAITHSFIASQEGSLATGVLTSACISKCPNLCNLTKSKAFTNF